MRRLIVCTTCRGTGELVKSGYNPVTRQYAIESKWCRVCGGVGYYPVKVEAHIVQQDRRQRRRNQKGNQA